MKPEEAQASVKLLLAVARADASVAEDERRTIGALAEKAGTSAEGVGAVDVDAELARITSPDARRLTMRGALAIAMIDGRCTPEEHRVLAKIHAAIGAGVELAKAEAEWTSRMADARRALGEATDAFLHAVGQASSSAELSTGQYERLVAELEAKKKDVLSRAIG